MGGIYIEETASVRAELFDRDLGGSGAQRDDLHLHFRLFGNRIALFIFYRIALSIQLRSIIDDSLSERYSPVFTKGLHNSLGDQKKRINHRKRQQDVEYGTGKINPEIADGLRRMPLEPADQGNESCHPGCRGHKVLNPEPDHLGEVAHRGLAAVTLPVRVRDKTDGSIERRVGRDSRKFLRIERQEGLQALQEI